MPIPSSKPDGGTLMSADLAWLTAMSRGRNTYRKDALNRGCRTWAPQSRTLLGQGPEACPPSHSMGCGAQVRTQALPRGSRRAEGCASSGVAVWHHSAARAAE